MNPSGQLCFTSATRMLEMLRERKISAAELTGELLDRIEKLNPRLNAVVTIAAERALKEAAESDRRYAKKDSLRPLEGLPITIKDSFTTADLRTTFGTRGFGNFVPKDDATAVARLRAAGAIVIGKTNLPELALGFDCENPVFGATHNPWNLSHVPGGSSGGEAAAIAAGMSSSGLGSDYGGSIRVPSHFCGIAGLRPTIGAIPSSRGPRDFDPPPVAAMATAGPMARYVDDLTLLFNVLRGPSPDSPNTLPTPEAALEQVKLRGMRCALFTGFGGFTVQSEVKEAAIKTARCLERLGLEIEEAAPPIERAIDTYNQFRMADGSRTTIEWLGDKIDLCRPQVKERLARPGAEKSASEVFAIMIARDRYRAELAAFMKRFPIVVTIPFRSTALLRNAPPEEIGGKSYDLFNAALPTNWPNIWVSCAGIPSVVVPAGLDGNGLPTGVKIVGRAFDESGILAVARAVESELGGFQPPPL